MANINDTAGARVVGGFHDSGRLGSRERVEPGAGPVIYNKQKVTALVEAWGNDDIDDLNVKDELKSLGVKQTDKGNAMATARALGLPEFIRGRPLGCGCDEAHLVGSTAPVGSHVEADYMCDSGWHNFVYFELIGFENKGESSIKVDANGNLVESTKTEARELSEF